MFGPGGKKTTVFLTAALQLILAQLYLILVGLTTKVAVNQGLRLSVPVGWTVSVCGLLHLISVITPISTKIHNKEI